MKPYILAIWGLLLIASASNAQENQKKPKSSFNGYLKDMVTVTWVGDSSFVDNLIHNRLNYKWYPASNITFYLEARTRFFAGDLVKTIPNYSDLIDVNDDFFDLSWTIVDNGSVVLHTMLDRAYVEWVQGDWEIRAGRQRINWGTNLVWNPNDVFNAYSFFDFDYEERPGSDALRVKKYTGFASSIEVAANFADNFDDMVIAGMWKINKKGYDLQFIAGKAGLDVITGIGWAGNIKTAGFKGEITLFQPYDTEESEQAILSSVSIDYSFKNSLYLHGSVLYASNGVNNPPPDFFILNARSLTAKNLSPYRWNTFLQSSYQFHPLITGGIAFIYYPANSDTFINPNVTISIVKNLDLDLIGQLFLAEIDSNALFGRLKWSF